MGVIITAVNIKDKTVKTGEKFTISVSVKETISEPISYRLPFKLNFPKGGIK